MIIVCPYDRISSAAEKYKPTAAISILEQANQAPSIRGIAPNQHLRLSLSMAEAEILTTPSPESEHKRIRQLINFAKRIDWGHALLIHCRLGLSRSPAAAFIIQCALSPNRDEFHIAEEMRHISAYIEPSIMMVIKADDLLKRGGRMVDALDHIEPGEPCFAGEVFEIPYLPQA